MANGWLGKWPNDAAIHELAQASLNIPRTAKAPQCSASETARKENVAPLSEEETDLGVTVSRCRPAKEKEKQFMSLVLNSLRRSLAACPAAVLVTAVTALLSPPLLAGPSINLQFLAEKVRVRQITPFAEVVFFGTYREKISDLVRSTTRVEPGRDTNGNGRATFNLQSEVVDKSIWAAVDFETGKFVVDAPASSPLQEIAAPQEMLETPGLFSGNCQHLELLVVRPQAGAWHGKARDGGPGDVGAGSDGKVLLPFTSFVNVENFKSPYLSEVAVGDLVIGIDPTLMTYFVFYVS